MYGGGCDLIDWYTEHVSDNYYGSGQNLCDLRFLIAYLFCKFVSSNFDWNNF